MVDYTYGPQPAVDITTAALVSVAGLAGSVHASEADANAGVGALTVTLAGGVSSTSIPVSSFGLTVEFTVPDHYQVWWKSGVYVVHLMSFDGIVDAVEAAAEATQVAVEDVVLSVNGQLPDGSGNVVVEGGGGGDGSATWGSLPGKPSTFPPTAHTHSRSEISDASGLGRQLISAADAQAARALIGAGTGNGTSNLALGSTASTAAPGNHAHAQYVDSSTAATIADERIAASGGGGGGGGSVMVWRYRSGAYPTLPATAPAGVELVMAVGPLQPSTVPSWIGNGPSQVPAEYTYNGGLA